MQKSEITPIAHIHSPYSEKFGIPRQSNIVCDISSTIVFEPDYRNADALRGIEEFDYLWLIWQFSENLRSEWSPTVRPPRLGGNRRMGVFATRSSFRPNSLALSSVRLLNVEWQSPSGPLLIVSGADLKDNTPIFDIKPYLPYTDAHPDARSGFAPQPDNKLLKVEYSDSELNKINDSLRKPLLELLSRDPRPSYHNNPERIYGFTFSGHEISFKVPNETTLQIINIV